MDAAGGSSGKVTDPNFRGVPDLLMSAQQRDDFELPDHAFGQGGADE